MRDGVMGTSPLSLSLQDLLCNGEADTSWYGMCVYSLGLVRYIGQGELKEKRDGCKKNLLEDPTGTITLCVSCWFYRRNQLALYFNKALSIKSISFIQ